MLPSVYTLLCNQLLGRFHIPKMKLCAPNFSLLLQPLKTPLCFTVFTVFSFSTSVSMDIWVAATLGLMWGYECLLSIPCVHPQTELPDHMALVILFLIFEKLPYHFPWWLHHLTIPPTGHQGSNFSTSSPTLGTSWFLDCSL